MYEDCSGRRNILNRKRTLRDTAAWFSVQPELITDCPENNILFINFDILWIIIIILVLSILDVIL
jgi:hypothetical protein